MPEYRKMAAFIPVDGERSLDAEFECWHPSPEFALKEADGFKEWKGGALNIIKAEAGLPLVDLPAQLEHMVKYCWQKASGPSAGVTRGRVQISGARQNRLDTMAKSMNPADIFKQARTKLQGQSYVPQVQPMKPFAGPPGMAGIDHLKGIATDWRLMEHMERVSAYTFRGDTRPLAAVKTAGGFHPPITRTDTWYVDNVIFPQFASYMKRRFQVDVSKGMFDQAYAQQGGTSDAHRVLQNFVVWQSLVQNETYHLGRMLADEALKGYTSTTRATGVAKGFAGIGGWVYLTLVQGGYLVPEKGRHAWTAIFGEQEVALPASIPWANVFGFRRVAKGADGGKKFAGPIYFRKGFAARNADAFHESYQLFSGKVQ